MIALFVRTYLVQAFQIPSASMRDSILVGDHILVNKFAYGPTVTRAERELLPFRSIARNDIIIFKFPGQPEKDYVKRVIGLPGETLKIENRQVKIKKPGDADFVALSEEDYVLHIDPPSAPDPDRLNNREPVKIPENCYYVLGDNREDSRDSRDWDCVPGQYIRGKALLVYWSVNLSPPPPEDGAPSGALATFWQSASGTFTRTRWERTFQLLR
jgi:signal peptidase I